MKNQKQFKVQVGDYGQSFGHTGGDGAYSGPSSSGDNVGPNDSNSGDGVVYEDNDPITKEQDRVETTPKEDNALQDIMKNDLGKNGDYSVYTNNCRDYSKGLFERLKEELEKMRKDENCKK